MVADLVGRDRRGTAFGWYCLAVGIGALPASVLFGFVWDGSARGQRSRLGAALASRSLLPLVVRPRKIAEVARRRRHDGGAAVTRRMKASIEP